MRSLTALRIALLLGAFPALSGCVAIAIPAVAGAMVAKKQISKKDEPKQTPAAPPEQRVAVFVGEGETKASLAPITVPGAVAGAVPGTKVPADTALAANPAPNAISAQSTEPTAALAALRSAPLSAMEVGLSTKPVLPPAIPFTPLTAPASTPAEPGPANLLPRPAPAAPRPGLSLPVAPANAGSASSGYLGLAAYVISHVGAPERDSALDVIDPNDPLSAPRRAQCGGLAPAVIIDLDPGLAVFNPQAASAQPGLADALAALRASGTVIMWSSALPVEQSEQVHAALARTGLDPNGTDRLLLLKGDGDRKQARRLSAARNWCVIAMAGDRRGDFDEAFDYLRDPDAVIPADALFGKGWFMAPAPIPQD